LSDLHTSLKFVHGNLDANSVFIESTDRGELVVKIDISEHHALKRLLRVSFHLDEDTEAESPVEEQDKGNAYEEFRKRGKVTVQSDVQAFGQLVLLMMKHTELGSVANHSSSLLSDLV